MRLTRYFIVTSLLGLLTTSVYAQKQKEDARFPTDDEVRLVLTQTERAVGQYKLLLDVEEKVFGKEGADVVAKDRETVRDLDAAKTGFGKNPQAFNGPLGFAFFEWLDDACRNALLSSVSASNTATVALIDGDKVKAQANIDLAKDLANASTNFYTVSENAGALYARYVEGIEQAAELSAKTATECADILKE